MTRSLKQPGFLPMTREEMRRLGWNELDVLLVSGDAYVDHPSFGTAVIGRYLVSRGFRTGVIAQPDWKQPQEITRLGRPRLFAGITAGAMDSLVANYTANKKLRRDDAYAPGGAHGRRPNRASIIYANLIQRAFPGLAVVLGGIEASLRRLAHYDYWEDRVRRSLLLDAKADLIVYGMGELAVAEIARRLDQESDLAGIPGTAAVVASLPGDPGLVMLPSYEDLVQDRRLLTRAATDEERAREGHPARVIAQPHGKRWVAVYPPSRPLGAAELDEIYGLPFAREAHPSYAEPVPALEPVRHSIITHRGCFGGCSFCALGLHQGKVIQSRSAESVLAEARRLAARPDFHGTLTDLGGPTANMYGLRCSRPHGPCSRPSCLVPEVCRHLETSHAAQLKLLKQAAAIPGVRHVFVASGIRYDLALCDPGYLSGLVHGGHVSGALKVAPEHADSEVLALMRKPPWEVFERFVRAYQAACTRSGQRGLLTAYFIASFPGADAAGMKQAAVQAKRLGLRVEQMQDFIPLPMTLAGVMYATGENPWTRKKLAVPRTHQERRRQRQTLLRRGSARTGQQRKPA
ncbi:MAG: YgiQ family radical SAM protein [candidate division FCPU426 bacterium]